MKKLDYLLMSFREGSFMYKEWIIECFGIVHFEPKPEELYNYEKVTERMYSGLAVVSAREESLPVRYKFEHHPMKLFADGDKVVFCHPETHEWVELEGVVPDEPVLKFNTEVQLKKGDMVNLNRDVTTWIGNMIINQIVLVYPFGNIIPFMTGNFAPSDIEKKISGLITTTPKDPLATRDPKLIYTDVLEELYYQAVYSIDGWLQLSVPAATEYTITTDPKIAALRKKLVKENWDAIQAGDKVVITKVMNELIKADMEFQDGDPEGGFLKVGKKKLFNIVRARQYLMYGLEWDFTDPTKAVLIERPLEEGWDVTKLDYMANSIISGSYNRGANTALGGELAKIITRFFLNTYITEDDCKTKIGYHQLITPDLVSGYDQTNFKIDGKWKLLTANEVSAYVGKTMEIRSPMYCLTGEDSFCLECMGHRFENLRTSLASIATSVGNIIMYIFMKRMHGVELATVVWELDELF